MSKTRLTVFLCQGKDCRKAWKHVSGGGSPGKWLKRRVEEAGLPYKLRIVKTESWTAVRRQHACAQSAASAPIASRTCARPTNRIASSLTCGPAPNAQMRQPGDRTRLETFPWLASSARFATATAGEPAQTSTT